MQTPLLSLFILSSSLLTAQIITTDPAAPLEDAPVTLTFDATQGTAGLRDCNCDVYLHTGLITPASNDGGDWQNIKTTWAVADDAWKLSPVTGQPNKYTYTIGPSVREYYGVGEDTEILRLAFVFRNADGSLEGKATGGQNIFVDVSRGGQLAVNLLGDPGTDTYPLGKPLPLSIGTTTEASIEIFDNDVSVFGATGQELKYDLRLTEPGEHTVRVVATADGQSVTDSFTITGRLVVELLSPEATIVTGEVGQEVTIRATSWLESELFFFRADGSGETYTVTGSELERTVTLPEGDAVTYSIEAVYSGELARASVTFITGAPAVAEVPEGFGPGATVMENGEIMFVLRAPLKQDVFVVSDLTGWSPLAATRMTRTPNDTTFWLRLDPSDYVGCVLDGDPCPDKLLYQYAIDDDGRFADPYSTLVLDPDNDPFIEEATFAGIPDYPTGEAGGIVSWLRLGQPAYEWQVNDFAKPDPTKMVVYELLVRDFLADHSYASLTDTLDYLERLGINTIELMPVNEFEGNISWGYNPSFHMALDKYYGSPEDLKAFVDEAHARGIAVVLDVVYNHAFGQSPLIRMWPGAQAFEPGADNPYANVTARHPFNVGYDLNHESTLVKEYVKVTLQYWLEEFRIDGFRFDLSKGFTQRQSDDVDAWNEYDATRIATLQDYADLVWSVDGDAYMIMEHLAENREEDELAEYGNGMYFWSGFQPHDAYLEAAMGYHDDGKSNIRSALANNSGFSGPNLIAYMESHDEERMMHKNLSFGNRTADYSTRELPTALDRVELASTFFYTLPGPKMLWQFGELGYDFPINYCADDREDEACRTDPKPIVWEYRNDPDRQDVYATISDLLYLRNNFDYFHGALTAVDLLSEVKYVHFSSDDGEAAIFGNFAVTPRTLTTSVPSAGTWYDYFSGETVTVTSPTEVITLAPGEYRVYLSQSVERGGGRLVTSTNDAAVAELAFTVSPNPTTGILRTNFSLPRAGTVEVTLYDLTGRALRQLHRGSLPAGPRQLEADFSHLPGGTYLLRITDGNTSAVRKVVIQ